MPLTQQQQVAIAAAYAPILCLHPDERFVPVKPAAYLQGAALWHAQPPTDRKADWGPDSGPGFPRRPTIPRGGISLDPAEDTEGTVDTDGDGVTEWYLGHRADDGTLPYLTSHEGREVWLDSAGWAGGQEVTDTSDNSSVNTAGAVANWQEQGLFRTVTDWYHAEVSETEDLQRLLIALGNGGGSVEAILREALGDIWVVWYYLLYPIHEEYLKRCEQVLDVSHRGDYEGDWNAVGVVVRKPLVLPWEAPGTPFPAPSHVAFGVRSRGLAKEVAPSLAKQGMLIRRWDQVSRLGLHPRVFVARGYHNNYSEPGDHDPAANQVLGIPLEKLTCEVVRELDEAANDVQETLDDIGETLKDIVVTVAKIAAGAGVGFGFLGPLGAGIGALAGAAAGVIEALSTSNTDDAPSEEVQKQLEREPGPPPGRYGLVLKPPDVADPLLDHPTDPALDETAVTVRDWLGSDLEKLVDHTTQLWWPSNSVRPGFDGRWGVRCTDDPNDRRSGITFPDFRAALLNDLAVHLAKTT